MSEAVGSGPRKFDGSGDIIPRNSHKERTQSQGQTEPPKLSPVIKNPGRAVKQPWYKRAGRSFVAEDGATVGEYLLIDVLVPGLKNILRDIVVGGIDRSLYGQSGVRSTRGMISSSRGSTMSIRTKYSGHAEDRDPRPQLSREVRNTHDFQQITMETRQEAVAVLEGLMSHIEAYGQATVADFYDLTDYTSDWPDRDWGWKDLTSAGISQHRGGFLIDLPQPKPFRG